MNEERFFYAILSWMSWVGCVDLCILNSRGEYSNASRSHVTVSPWQGLALFKPRTPFQLTYWLNYSYNIMWYHAFKNIIYTRKILSKQHKKTLLKRKTKRDLLQAVFVFVCIGKEQILVDSCVPFAYHIHLSNIRNQNQKSTPFPLIQQNDSNV